MAISQMPCFWHQYLTGAVPTVHIYTGIPRIVADFKNMMNICLIGGSDAREGCAANTDIFRTWR